MDSTVRHRIYKHNAEFRLLLYLLDHFRQAWQTYTKDNYFRHPVGDPNYTHSRKWDNQLCPYANTPPPQPVAP